MHVDDIHDEVLKQVQHDYLSIVSRQASAKSGENNGGLVRLQGLAIFAEAGATSERQQRKRLQPRFSSLCAQKPRAEKPPADKPFGYFVATK